jgi:predicted DNA-binding ribbon-helix-helix protein
MPSSLECDVPADADKNALNPNLPHSTLVSRNVTIAGHRTSVRLEPEMWSGLTDICRRERMIMHEVCTAVATNKKKNTSLTAAIRVFVMSYYRSAATEDGHNKAGHGYGGLRLGLPASVPIPHQPGNSNNMPADAAARQNGRL